MSIGDTDFGVQVSIGFIGRVVTALVAFIGSILLARVLGPENYGTFYTLMAVVLFLDNPVTGWASACRKRLTEEGFPSEEAVGSTFIAIIVMFGIIAVGAWGAAPLITSFTGDTNSWLLLTILFFAVVTYKTTNEILKSTDKFGSSTWLEASRDIVRVLAQVALVLLGLGVAGMVGGMVLANLVVAPIVLYLIGIRPKLPSRETIEKLWSYARYSVPSGVVTTAQQRMDLLLLAFLAGPAVAGNYEVAFKLTMPAMFIAGVAQNGLMGRISNLQSRNRSVDADIQNNLAYASLIGIPLFFGALIMAGPIIVTLYSSQYAAAAPFLAGLAFFRLLRTQKVILTATLNGLDRPDLNLRVAAVVFPINLLLGVGLLFVIGPIGVVIATVVSEGIGYGARAYLSRSLVPSVRLFPRPLLKQIAAGIVMAGVVYTARTALPLGTWPVVALVTGLGGVTYVLVLVGISHELRATVISVGRDAGIW